ncbi:MAG: hypothetical protein ACFE9N_00765 [Promethearchaeota archaeon]
MKIINQEFDSIIKSKNPDEINDFLIKLSESPDIEYFIVIDYLIENLEVQIFEKIKLNLIFLIGEIAKLSAIDAKYLSFLSKTYYSSDRWVRDEIIQAIGKILSKTVIEEEIIKLLGYAINDDYLPIRINALKTLLDLEKLPLFVWRNIFLALNSKNSELEAISANILNKFLSGFNLLFSSLTHLENYKILKPNAIRALMLIYFKSPINLESFRESIATSNWENEYKENYLKEIDLYEKILMKRL